MMQITNIKTLINHKKSSKIKFYVIRTTWFLLECQILSKYFVGVCLVPFNTGPAGEMKDLAGLKSSSSIPTKSIIKMSSITRSAHAAWGHSHIPTKKGWHNWENSREEERVVFYKFWYILVSRFFNLIPKVYKL